MAVDLQERQQRAVEARRLEVSKLVSRGHEGLGIGCAAELEVKQWNTANRPLLDHPGCLAMQTFLDEDARHVGGHAEA